MDSKIKKIPAIGTLAILLTSSLTIMVGTVIAPSLPEIAKQLGFSKSPGWLITLPSLGVVLFAPFVGPLIDRRGSFVTMCIGLIPYALLGLAGAYLHSTYLIIADRILLGGATAAVQASATALIAEFYTGTNRIKMIAWQGMAIELGGVIFLSIGGVLGELGWHYPFFIYLTALVGLLLLFAGTSRVRRVAVRNFASASPQKTISKNVIKIVTCSAFAMILFFVAFIELPQYLHKSFDFSDSQTGYFMAFVSLIAVATGSLLPFIIRKYTAAYVLAMGFSCMSLGYFLFLISHTVTLMVFGATAIGIGFALTVPLLNHMMLEKSTNENRGRNLGFYSMGVFGGQFISSFIEMISPDITVSFAMAILLGAAIAISLYRLEKKMKQGSQSAT